ncbi:MAG: cytochrome c [Phycisphaeraceae bacterium]|nr:cytochrome c [Phycisphaeraceae bacterium]MCW5754559.1 cytochrome c [Phycisphaeraceae bacterium]
MTRAAWGLAVVVSLSVATAATFGVAFWLLRSGPRQASSSPMHGPPAVSEADRAARTLVDRGRNYSMYLGCNACHSTDGSRMQGASWVGLYGSTIRLSDGRTVIADEAYIRRSIVDPGAELREGFANVMLPYDELTDEQLDALVAYIRSFATPDR